MVTNTTITTPGTLLEAINEMLRIVRIGRMQTLDAVERSLDASGAKATLDGVIREVLLRGWQFNTEFDYTLSPDETGMIVLPTNALKVTHAKYQSNMKRLLVRQRKLYDNLKHTFVIGEDALVDMVVAVSYEDLPESIKHLVVATAAQRWCQPKLPSGASFQITTEYLKECMSRALQDEVDELADEDLKSTSPHFAKMARRRVNGGSYDG